MEGIACPSSLPDPVVALTPDPLTPNRDITHQHFQAGDTVVVLKGVAGGELWGDAMRVVAPSWHLADRRGRLALARCDRRAAVHITAHPRYLVHLSRRCPDCLIHLRAMEDALLPKYPDDNALIDCGWYTTTAVGQLVHVDDARAGR